MKLTKENKDYIDGLDIQTLLYEWRYSKFGNAWFQDKTGIY